MTRLTPGEGETRGPVLGISRDWFWSASAGSRSSARLPPPCERRNGHARADFLILPTLLPTNSSLAGSAPALLHYFSMCKAQPPSDPRAREGRLPNGTLHAMTEIADPTRRGKRRGRGGQIPVLQSGRLVLFNRISLRELEEALRCPS